MSTRRCGTTWTRRSRTGASRSGWPWLKDRACCQSNLALALKLRYQRRGTLVDLAEAVDLSRAAATSLPGAAHTFAAALAEMFQQTEDPAVLDEAVAAMSVSLKRIPEDSPGWALDAGALASLLRRRSQDSGDRGDRERALELARKALERTPASHRDYAGRLGILASVLSANARDAGSASDQAEAVALSRQAVAGVPAGDADYPRALLNFAKQLSSSPSSTNRGAGH